MRAGRTDPGVRRLLADPYSLSPNRGAEPDHGREAELTRIVHDDLAGQYVGPFIMAGINTRVVRRSNALLDHGYGPGFRYREVTGLGESHPQAIVKGLATAGPGSPAAARQQPAHRRPGRDRAAAHPPQTRRGSQREDHASRRNRVRHPHPHQHRRPLRHDRAHRRRPRLPRHRPPHEPSRISASPSTRTSSPTGPASSPPPPPSTEHSPTGYVAPASHCWRNASRSGPVKTPVSTQSGRRDEDSDGRPCSDRYCQLTPCAFALRCAASTVRRNSAITAVPASGCSTRTTWPASGMETSRAPGMA